MFAIWTTVFLCPRDISSYDVLSDGRMIILRTLLLNSIPIKHRTVVLSEEVTGWTSGLMQRGPPG